MREKKFRAWDKQLGKMVFFTGIFNRQPYEETSTFPQYESVPKYHHLIVMDYTGLKDKNGKAIYEGDIIQFSFKTGDTETGIVEWSFYNDYVSNVECWMANRLPISDKGGLWGAYRYEIEVIGNIYENPT